MVPAAGRTLKKDLRISYSLIILGLISNEEERMPEPIEVRIHVPDNLGLTEQQIAALKQKVRVEIVASTMPVRGLAVKTPQQIVIQMVEHNHWE